MEDIQNEHELELKLQKESLIAEIDKLKQNDVNLFIANQSRNIGSNMQTAVDALLKLSRQTK